MSWHTSFLKLINLGISPLYVHLINFSNYAVKFRRWVYSLLVFDNTVKISFLQFIDLTSEYFTSGKFTAKVLDKFNALSLRQFNLNFDLFYILLNSFTNYSVSSLNLKYYNYLYLLWPYTRHSS